MDVVYRCCAGIDVHKKSITVNLLRRGVEGKADYDEVRYILHDDPETHGELSDWLRREGVRTSESRAPGYTGNRFITFSNPSSPSFS